MTNQNRLDLQWRLLTDAYPKFCVRFSERFSASSLLVEPKETDDSSVRELHKAKQFYENLVLLPDDDLRSAGQSLSAREQAAHEAKHVFNHPQALADEDVFGFWGRAEVWTAAEAAALINGRNPSIVTEDRIEDDRTDSKISNTLRKILVLFERARQAGSLNRSNSPKKLIDWLELKHIDMPERLKELTLQFSETPYTMSAENRRLKERIAELETNPIAVESLITEKSPEKPLGSRERESLLKLVLGMAVDGYGYDPKATKSIQVKAIADHLLTRGLSINEDTVRKYLNEAKVLFADVITEQKG